MDVLTAADWGNENKFVARVEDGMGLYKLVVDAKAGEGFPLGEFWVIGDEAIAHRPRCRPHRHSQHLLFYAKRFLINRK